MLHIFYYILWLIPQCQSSYCTAHNRTGAAASYDLISFHRRLGSKQVVFRDISNNLQYRICTVSSVCTEMKRKLFLTPRWVRDSFLNTFSTYLHLSYIVYEKILIRNKLIQSCSRIFKSLRNFFLKVSRSKRGNLNSIASRRHIAAFDKEFRFCLYLNIGYQPQDLPCRQYDSLTLLC